MFNKNCVYRHFKGMLYLPIGETKSATDNQSHISYLPLYKADYQGVYNRPFNGEDGFFSEMPEGKKFYANKKMRFEEVEYENLYLMGVAGSRSYPISHIELMTNSNILIVTVIVDGNTLNEQDYHFNIDSSNCWREYEIIEALQEAEYEKS